MRLGDAIDDYCTRCKRGTNHAIVAMNGGDVLKVLCRTCNTEHPYRHNENPKKELTKEVAFQKVLESVTGQIAGSTSTSGKKKRGK